MSLTASDTDEWVCSGEEPKVFPPSQSTWPSIDLEPIRILTHAVEELGRAWSAPEDPTHGLLDKWFLKGHRQPSSSQQSVSSSFHTCKPQRAHENMANSIVGACELNLTHIRDAKKWPSSIPHSHLRNSSALPWTVLRSASQRHRRCRKRCITSCLIAPVRRLFQATLLLREWHISTRYTVHSTFHVDCLCPPPPHFYEVRRRGSFPSETD